MEERIDVWPDAASVASWPEIAANNNQLPPHCCCTSAATPRGHLHGTPHRPSLLDMQRAAADGDAVGASLLGSVRRRQPIRTAGTYIAACLLCLVLVAVAGMIALTVLEFFPWPLRLDSPEWLMAWLIAAIAEARGASLCMCSIVAASERPCAAVVWVAICLAGGTPGTCVYLVARLLRHGTLRLTVAQRPSALAAAAAGRGRCRSAVDRAMVSALSPSYGL